MSAFLVDVYKDRSDRSMLLFLRRDETIPIEGAWEFERTIDLGDSKPYLVDKGEARQAIEARGYFVATVRISFDEKPR